MEKQLEKPRQDKGERLLPSLSQSAEVRRAEQKCTMKNRATAGGGQTVARDVPPAVRARPTSRPRAPAVA